MISGIDWQPDTNQIVTCSHDRNVFVWKHVTERKYFEAGEEKTESVDKWDTVLVLPRIDRAATSVKWSPLGNKFALTSAAKKVPVCFFSEENNWWNNRHSIKKHKSTVVAVDWCPNNMMIVTGCTDYKCRIISAFDKDLEEVDADEIAGFKAMFPKIKKFGSVLAEFDQAKAWVQGVSWSPNMYRLAFTGHGSTIHFVQLIADGPPEVTTIRQSGLPYVSVEFVSNQAVVAAGYDQNPHLYVASDANGASPEWSFEGKVDKEKKIVKKKKSVFGNARNLFESKASRGEASAKSVRSSTVHQNCINQIVTFEGSGSFVTAGIDGIIAKWELGKQGFDEKKLLADD